MRNRMDVIADIIDEFLQTLQDFDELDSWETIGKENTADFRVYKVWYINLHQAERILRLEMDFEKEVLSYGSWDLGVINTIAFESFIDIDRIR
jgi:hypothetical protein